MNENYYRILGLDNFASDVEIKRAYRQLAKKYHPDKNQNTEEQFKRITEAYKKLSDPAFRSLQDEWLRNPTAVNQQVYNRYQQKPTYRKRTRYYTTERTHFSPKVKMYGSVFIIAFVMAIILIPIGLMYKASSYHFNQAEEYRLKGQFGNALLNYKQAITWFGEKTEEASVAAARIGLYNLNNADQATFFITKGLEYASNPYFLGELHFLKGRIYSLQNEVDKALEEYQIAENLGYLQDSIALNMGIIRAFYQDEFEEGISEFDKILAQNMNNEEALFGKAWCTQRLNRPLQSLEMYNDLLKINPEHVLGNFYRGHNQIVLGDTLNACRDFKKAYQLGYQPAFIYYSRQCGNYQ
ncbi:tetratricopeptide repeat protein [Fulvivirga lutea]|uniref:DnaJ domain-containing protein n=1 Tax=Fulvivirga lutea TaxID=2810512 RepID=A0A975A0D5_9BACT|nr:tetratricopeptide repeat protein [Fulvivirga lutea]QSE96701.1 DnaJ domain-containing protein [Fulvivirga lutea]